MRIHRRRSENLSSPSYRNTTASSTFAPRNNQEARREAFGDSGTCPPPVRSEVHGGSGGRGGGERQRDQRLRQRQPDSNGERAEQHQEVAGEAMHARPGGGIVDQRSRWNTTTRVGAGAGDA